MCYVRTCNCAGQRAAVMSSGESTNAGNLVQDEKFTYTYDAWNRLVKVTARADSGVTIHTASYDGRGRRLKKVVTNTGQHDGTVVFYYGGWKIIETRDGSGNLYQQFIHGTQYIDELVMMRVKDKGDLYVHQDANWNVIALTDLGGNVVERYTYTPYGQMTVQQVTSYGDRDGDRVVDSTDKGTPGTTCTGTVTGSCRIVDLDFDGDYDATDATLFDNLDQGQARHPDRTTTAVDFPFGHQGLYYDAELDSCQNRYRQFAPVTKRFMQRDLHLSTPRPETGYEDSLSLYCYVRGNPITLLDPSGQQSMPCPHWFDPATTPFQSPGPWIKCSYPYACSLTGSALRPVFIQIQIGLLKIQVQVWTVLDCFYVCWYEGPVTKIAGSGCDCPERMVHGSAYVTTVTVSASGPGCPRVQWEDEVDKIYCNDLN